MELDQAKNLDPLSDEFMSEISIRNEQACDSFERFAWLHGAELIAEAEELFLMREAARLKAMDHA